MELAAIPVNGHQPAGSDALRRPDPVFVLCMGRSGSTLLRFILDAHPMLACPPETNLPALCGQLAVVWSLIEGAPLSEVRGDTPPVVPDTAIAGIRQTIDTITGSYLQRRGKQRFCDKSLGAARYAELLLRVYPQAKFLCLYRHPMDVIASGLDACPWGLNGYGFDSYIGATPGNAVMALARFWLDNARAIAAAEDSYPAHCHRVRYEDMTGSPAETAAGIFKFISVPAVPDIEDRIFTAEHERFGPGDHKIWHTSEISSRSVGGGESIPAGLIPPFVLEPINELASRLGYVRVDEQWGTAGMPAELRTDAPATRPRPEPVGDLAPAVISLLARRLHTSVTGADPEYASRWDGCLVGVFDVAVRSPCTGEHARWRVNLAERTIVPAGEDLGDQSKDDDLGWSVVGGPQAWQAVLTGERNLSAALRHYELRYCDLGDASTAMTDARITMLAELLGLGQRQLPAPDTGKRAPATVPS